MWSTGINRNIVECKEHLYRDHGSVFSAGINRNIVECKDSLFSESPAASLVLIETLWNVKGEGRKVYPRNRKY